MLSRVKRVAVNLHWFKKPIEKRDGIRIPSQGRRLVREAIDAGGNDYLIVFIIGLSFFCDSYLLFAGNAVVPCLSYVYWNEETRSSHDLVVNLATLAGCVVGMALFGWLSDKLGRVKVLGWNLLLLIAGSTGVIMSSPGYSQPLDPTQDTAKIDWSNHGSMNVLAWLIWWRFVSGVGLGGDYPLSAVIVSEMAPTKNRARMLAATFSMQAFGYAAASIVALVVTIIVRSHHPIADASAVDQIWRWVIGLGLIPATAAAFLRQTIPESPRYTLHVLDDSTTAFDESDKFNNAQLGPEWAKYVKRNATLPQESRNSISIHGSDTNVRRTVKLDEIDEIDQSTISARQYFFKDGNWRSLAGTATSWFLLDIGFYALSLNSPRLIAKLWYQNTLADQLPWATDPNAKDPEKGIYTILIMNSAHSLAISSVAAVVGAISIICLIDKFNRKRFQIWTFLILAILFIITGASFPYTVQSGFHGVTLMLFVACVLVFYFGPNTLTYIIPAELFPTKYRATCHGLSAAAGKLGSIIVLCFLEYVNFGSKDQGETDSLAPDSKWLGWVLLVFSIPMFFGAFVTWLWIPNLQDEHGKDKCLEELVFVRGVGTMSRKDIEMGGYRPISAVGGESE